MKKQICLTVSTVLLLAATRSGWTQTSASATPKQPAPVPQQNQKDMPSRQAARVAIPQMTLIPVTLKDTIPAGANKLGSKLLFVVAKDIYGPEGTFLIARGALGRGEIVEVDARKDGQAGKLGIRCDYILAPDETHIPLRGAQMEFRGKASDGTLNVTGRDGDGVIVEKFAGGKDASLPLGKTYSVYVNVDTQIAPPPKSGDSAVLRKGFVFLKNGDWFVGSIRQVGQKYIITNSNGSHTVKISDVRSLEYTKDVE